MTIDNYRYKKCIISNMKWVATLNLHQDSWKRHNENYDMHDTVIIYYINRIIKVEKEHIYSVLFLYIQTHTVNLGKRKNDHTITNGRSILCILETSSYVSLSLSLSLSFYPLLIIEIFLLLYRILLHCV